MANHRSRCSALLLALALVASGALAGEIILFEAEGFRGNRIAFQDTVPNLDGTGFNDRAASISVRDGTWEVCVDAGFQGPCMQLQPGDYPQLNPPFDRRISSLRQVGGADYGGSYIGPPPQSGVAPEITLFDSEGFQGNRITFTDVVPNLDGTGFNDRTASISIRGVPWEVCIDAGFQGGCIQLQPGDYPQLNPPFDRRISSLRPLGGIVGSYGAPMPVPQVDPGFGVPGISIGISLPLFPDLAPVPGYPVYYAPQLNSNYFFYDGMFWVFRNDNWYTSSWYNGPWAYVAADVVPLFVLRVPVGYYRQPPPYFRHWNSNAPPHWGEHWGNAWAQSHRGWDNWNRSALLAPAPLPTYQRQYSGNRYPVAAQQRVLQNQNYRYQPRDVVVQQHYRAQHGTAGPPSGQTQRSGGEIQRPPTSSTSAQRVPSPSPGQPPQQGTIQRPAPPTPQQGTPVVPRGQPSQQGARETRQPPAQIPAQQGAAAPVPRGQPERREVQRPAASPPTQQAGPTAGSQRQQPRQLQQPPAQVPAPQGAVQVPRGQPSAQPERREVQRPAAAPPQQGAPTGVQRQPPPPQRQDREPPSSGPSKEPKQGQANEREKGEQRDGGSGGR